MGLFDSVAGLFGGGVEAPTIEALPLDQFNTGVENLIRGQAKVARERQTQVSGLTADLLDQLKTLGDFPTLDEGSLESLKYAESIFNKGLASVQANNINSTTQSIQGLAASLGLQGVPLQGAGAASLASGIAAKNQASANQSALSLASVLNEQRNNLLNFAMTRTLNKYNATAGAQSSLTGQQGAAFANVFNANTAERAYKTDINETNAQMQMQADIANSASSSSMFSSLLSSATSLGTAFLGR